jgi:hypothetical protein
MNPADIKNQVSSKKSSVKKKKEYNERDIILKEEERRLEREKLLKERERELKPWIEQLFQQLNNKEKVLDLFIKWGIERGYSSQRWYLIVEKLIREGNNYNGFIKMVSNEYLNCFSDCASRFRKTRFKRIKYQFEKEPPSKKTLEQQKDIKEAISLFVEAMRTS